MSFDFLSWKCACCDPAPRTTPVANAVKKRKPLDPFRFDPSRTGPLQKRFMKELRLRFSILKRAIRVLVDEEDAFGLKPTGSLLKLAERRRWRFLTSDKKVGAYRFWLQEQIDAGILEVQDGETAWTAKYIRGAYRQGAARAYADVKKINATVNPGSFAKSRDEFMLSSFGGPVAEEKMQLLATRTFEGLRGVTTGMSSRMSRVLVTGMAEGTGALELASQLADEVNIGLNRARVIARTEIMHAHAEGQLDAFEALDVEELGVMAEWSTAGDDRVCPVCLPLEGMILTVKEARGMLPRHPNCRCTWIPANVTEKEAKQKRSKSDITGAIIESLKEETGEKKKKDAKAASRWVGADKPISGKKSQYKKKGK